MSKQDQKDELTLEKNVIATLEQYRLLRSSDTEETDP